MLARLGDVIYSFGCIVAAAILGIGVFDYWFGKRIGCARQLGGTSCYSVGNRQRNSLHSDWSVVKSPHTS